MGNTETKQVDSTGEVINTVIMNPEDINFSELKLLLTILTSLAGLSLAYQLYKDFRRSIKKKYTEGVYNTNQP